MRSAEPASGRHGFTLLEVMVALVVASLVLLAARELFGRVADAAERIGAAAREADASANAERLARDLVARAEARLGDPARFRGTTTAARWSSWCDTPAGWQERCTVTLGLVRVGERHVLALGLPDGNAVPVRTDFQDGHMVYLRDAARGGTWQAAWNSDAILPIAVGVVLDADTLLLRTGDRGLQ